MNCNSSLILVNGKDKTQDICFCRYNTSIHKYEVTYRSGKQYLYDYNSIEWVRNPEALNPALVHVARGGQRLLNIQRIFVFHAKSDDYWRICFADDSGNTYPERELKASISCLSEEKSLNRLEYLKQLAAISELKSENGIILLKKQYENLDFVDRNSTMANYLNPVDYPIGVYNKSYPIFPFGGNATQFQAVRSALENQVSVIQGPPGTGKTQTILNIIANLLLKGKTVLVVSNNNSAIENVAEKLASEKYQLGFLAAPLGNVKNKKAFIHNQTGTYPDLTTWHCDAELQKHTGQQVQALSTELSAVFLQQELLAKARLELASLRTEIHYFEEYCKETGRIGPAVQPKRKLSSRQFMRLWQECNKFSEKDHGVSFWFRIRSVLFYRIANWMFFNSDMPSVISLLQGMFYRSKEEELCAQIGQYESSLAQAHAAQKMDELTQLSMQLLRAKLFERYRGGAERKRFSEDNLWRDGQSVISEYPVVLSTTFSSRSCLKNVTYDYLIMDEASQVDIVTGALALSCAKNAVIVGDLKQLPNVVSSEMRKQSDAIFASFDLPKGYSFSNNSFLMSICDILHNVPQTLLREHYRCHPKIIGFCNEKFYNGELIIMTQDNAEADTLKLFETNEGNHRRDHINQRQIDVLTKEALPLLRDSLPEELGIITPYKDQATAIREQLDNEKIEVHTVHKFQGREKDTIVLTTVDDTATNFSDDPFLMNVAISRAKKRLFLVTSSNEQPADSNLSALISYIRYNNYQEIHSEIYSMFDLLYRQYSDARVEFLKKHARISRYDSENIMYGKICRLLDDRQQLGLNVIFQQPLSMLIRDPHLLNNEEYHYAMNTATHLDFLIYDCIRKSPVLAIEVDGFHFHKKGTDQYRRDLLKNHILELYGIPLLRFTTNGSGEIEQIAATLDSYALTMHKRM